MRTMAIDFGEIAPFRLRVLRDVCTLRLLNWWVAVGVIPKYKLLNVYRIETTENNDGVV